MEISSLVMYLSWDRVQVFPCQKPAAAACISYVILILCSHFFFSVVVIEGGEKRVHWKEGAKRERGSAEQTSSQSFKEEG